MKKNIIHSSCKKKKKKNFWKQYHDNIPWKTVLANPGIHASWLLMIKVSAKQNPVEIEGEEKNNGHGS